MTLILLGLGPDDINRPDLRLFFFALLHIIGIALANVSSQMRILHLHAGVCMTEAREETVKCSPFTSVMLSVRRP